MEVTRVPSWLSRRSAAALLRLREPQAVPPPLPHPRFAAHHRPQQANRQRLQRGFAPPLRLPLLLERLSSRHLRPQPRGRRPLQPTPPGRERSLLEWRTPKIVLKPLGAQERSRWFTCGVHSSYVRRGGSSLHGRLSAAGKLQKTSPSAHLPRAALRGVLAGRQRLLRVRAVEAGVLTTVCAFARIFWPRVPLAPNPVGRCGRTCAIFRCRRADSSAMSPP